LSLLEFFPQKMIKGLLVLSHHCWPEALKISAVPKDGKIEKKIGAPCRPRPHFTATTTFPFARPVST
jgi:hypothetical protein